MLKNLKLLDDWKFVVGAGDPSINQACAMSAFSILNGEKFSDNSPCVSPQIRRFVIGFNDRVPFDDLRERFAMNIVCHIGDTANDGHDRKRMYLVVEYVITACAKRAFEAAGWQDLAAKLDVKISCDVSLRESLAITECCRDEAKKRRDSAAAADAAAYAAAAAAAYAAADAYAAAAAYAAADAYAAAAAYAAADAYAAAAAATATAAYAYAAADAAAARRKMWEQLTTDAIAVVRRMAVIGKKELATGEGVGEKVRKQIEELARKQTA